MTCRELFPTGLSHRGINTVQKGHTLFSQVDIDESTLGPTGHHIVSVK